MIHRAKKVIQAKYYIIYNDEFGKSFMAALAKKSRESKGKVRVQLLVDGLGHGVSLWRSQINFLQSNGVEVRIFNSKLMHPFNIRYRMHDKILLVDDEVLVGSANIGVKGMSQLFIEANLWVKSKYFVRGIKQKFRKYWRSPEVSTVFFYHSVTNNSNELEDYAQRPLLKVSPPDIDEFQFINKFNSLAYFNDSPKKNPLKGPYAQIIKLIGAAKKNVTIVNPYMVLTGRLYNAFVRARQKGVKINIYGLSEKNLSKDTEILLGAYLDRFNLLEEAGVNLWEHQKFYLHSKYILVDEDKFILGSTNLDPISSQFNTENGVYINNLSKTMEGKSFVEKIKTDIESIHNGSIQVLREGERLTPVRPCKGLECSLWWLIYPKRSL